MENRRFFYRSLPTYFTRRISASVAHRNEIPKATPIFSGTGNPMASIGILYDVTRSLKSKMAAVKPGVFISQLLD